MGEIIVITSGKGGVGKTTTTANLGAGLVELGNKKVVLIDTDIGLRNLDVVMGLENRVVYDLIDVLEGKCRLKQALIKDKRYEGLHLLPAAQTKDKNAVLPEQMVDLCNELANEFDFVIVDCPAGIEQGFKNAIAGAKKAIVVTTPEISAVRDADRIIGLLQTSNIKNIKILINRIRINMVKQKNMMSVDDILNILGVEILGIVPDDESIIVATNKGEPIVRDEKAKAGIAYRNISRRILGERVPIMDLNNQTGFFNAIKKFFRNEEH